MTLPSSNTMVSAVNLLDHHPAIVGRKPTSPTLSPPPLPHPKVPLDERMMGLSIQQQYHHIQPPPLPPPSLHNQQMKNNNAATSVLCSDNSSLSFGPSAIRNVQYHSPPPPLTQHSTTQQQQQVLQQHLQHHQQQQQQLNNQYHAPRSVGMYILKGYKLGI